MESRCDSQKGLQSMPSSTMQIKVHSFQFGNSCNSNWLVDSKIGFTSTQYKNTILNITLFSQFSNNTGLNNWSPDPKKTPI